MRRPTSAAPVPVPIPIAAIVLGLGLVLAAPGCVPPPAAPHEASLAAVDVSDGAFASSLHRVLRDGGSSPDRIRVLGGVVRRQMTHAAQRFAAGHDADGTASVFGALYLVRVGEGNKDMIDAQGERALAGAIERVAPRGDEGRTLALMTARAAALPAGSKERTELDEHLAALQVWMRDTRTGGAMRRLGAEQRAKTARALVDPSPAALTEAAAAINAWIGQALEVNDEFRRTGRRPADREEAIEVQRALSSGAPTLASIYLRHGDAAGALKIIEESNARAVIQLQPELLERVRNAAMSDDPQGKAFHDLAGAVSKLSQEEGDPETDIDPELVHAALWGTALEAYRRNPGGFDTAFLVARSLTRLGMPEAAPLVLTDALAVKATPSWLNAALTLVGEAVAESARTDDVATARRTFEGAVPLLQIADRAEFAGRLDPSPSRVRAVMASVEVHAGDLNAARGLLRAAVAAEPGIRGFMTLALVERQAGDTRAALDAVAKGLAAGDAAVAPLDAVEARLLQFELYRDSLAPKDAKGSLDAALAAALVARQATGRPVERARAEQLFGRILEAYGDTKGSIRAFDRAMTIVASDKQALGEVMLDAIARAMVRRDLAAARAALLRGLDGDVGADDLAYGGLWVSLLERDGKTPPDGSASLALRAGGKSGWTSKLSAWASGKLGDKELDAAAQSLSQRVEAAFYTAMGLRVAGAKDAEDRLRRVAASPIIDILEVQIARDLTAPKAQQGPMPVGVKLP